MDVAPGDVPRLLTPQMPLSPLGSGPTPDGWRLLEPVSLREVTTGHSPAQATRVWTAWNAHEWRVLFEMDDAKPWATLTERDGPLWTEEVVEVFIDPVGDLQSYFEFEINPLATVTDLVLRRTGSGWLKEFGWDADGLETFARRTATGWEAELSIPFAALVSTAPTLGQLWRVNFLRIDRPLGPGSQAELSAWSPTGQRNFHRPASFGILEFGAPKL
jgi:hypothetical protein